MKRYIFILCIVIIICCFSGCESVFSSPEDNLKQPLATGFFEGVNDALENSVGEDIVLKYPLSDGSRSAFCAHDLDGDDVKEVLAFYSENKELAVPHMNLLKLNSSKEWESVQDIESVGSEITEIDFADLDGDGIDELFVGCSNYTTKTNMMDIYHMEKGLLIQRAMEQYTKYLICDIDNSGADNLVIALADQLNQNAKFSAFGFHNDKFTLLGSTPLDSSITTFSNITYGKLPSNRMAVFIDGNKAAETLITEVIYFNGKDYVNYFLDKTTMSNNATLRHSPLISCDINDDGYIDIPIGFPSQGPSNIVVTNTNELVKWVTFDENKMTEVFTAWYSIADGYYLNFNKDWIENISISYDDKLGMAIFSEYNKKTNVSTGEILRIQKMDVSEWTNSPPQNYIKIADKDDFVWIARINNTKSYLRIDRDTLIQRFRLIEQTASFIVVKL